MRILVFTRTAGYRHESIPDGIRAFTALGEEHGLAVDATEEADALAGPLHGYGAVVFLSTSGEVLTPEARSGLMAYCAAGGGFMGVHSAACAEEDWPFFGGLLGARFVRHPRLQPGTVVVEDADHPATRHLPGRWPLTDEWYDFDVSPRGTVRVLASADEASYEGGGMGRDHPLAWCHTHAGARCSTPPWGTAPRRTRIPTTGPISSAVFGPCCGGSGGPCREPRASRLPRPGRVWWWEPSAGQGPAGRPLGP